MSKPAMWTHKKQGKQLFKGSYQFNQGDRSFVLIGEKTGRQISFEAHEGAKQAGWKKATT